LAEQQKREHQNEKEMQKAQTDCGMTVYFDASQTKSDCVREDDFPDGIHCGSSDPVSSNLEKDDGNVNSGINLLAGMEVDEGDGEGVLVGHVSSVEQKAEEQKVEMATSTSVNIPTNGFLANSPFAELVVDIRDSLFNTATSEEKKTADQLVK
jgi:serine phosphatase RsbU (regulator of sigma subunit)